MMEPTAEAKPVVASGQHGRCCSWLTRRSCPLAWLMDRQRDLYKRSLLVVISLSVAYALCFLTGISSEDSLRSQMGIIHLCLCPAGAAFVAAVAYSVLVICTLSPCAHAVIFVLAFAIVNCCFCFAPVFNEDANFRVRSLAIAMATWKAAPAVLAFNPVMTGVFIVTSVCGDVAAHMLNEQFHPEDEFRPAMIVAMLVTSVLWYLIALAAHAQMRLVYEMERELVDDREPFRDMLAMVCDAAVWILRDASSEEEYKVYSTDGRLDLMIGRNMDGQPITGCCITDDDDEKRRLTSAFERSHQAPVSVPITLLTGPGDTILSNMLIVGRRCWSSICRVSGRRHYARNEPCWSYLVGFQTMQLSSGDGGMEIPAAATAGLAQQKQVAKAIPPWVRGMATAVESADEDDVEQGGSPKQPGCSIRDDGSMPDTTASGQVFKEADRLFDAPSELGTRDNVLSTLNKLERLGKRQGWLLDADDIIVHLDQILGAGAFGAVVGATMHGTAVAIKFPKNEGDGLRKKDLGSLVNEMRILRHVRHPNIVSFYGACVVPGGSEVSLVLERVYGLQLIEYLRKPSRSAEPDRFTLMVDVACALRYLHAQRPAIVHGDLKGSNILVETNFTRARLIDFGLARLLTKHAKRMGGSFLTVAPEILADPACTPTTCSDVFSFGRVAYMIVTGGRLPLEGIGAQFIQEMAMQGKPIPLIWPSEGTLIKEAETLLEQAMAVDKRARPSIAHIHQVIVKWRSSIAKSSKNNIGQEPQGNDEAETPTATGQWGDESFDSSGFSESCLSIVRTSLVKPSAPSVKSNGRSSQHGTPAVATWGQINEPPVQVSGPDDGQPRRGRLAQQNFKPTKRWAKETCLRDLLSTWNVTLPEGTCCDLHGGFSELERVLKRLQAGACEPNYGPLTDWQCPNCALLYRMDEVEDATVKNCGFCSTFTSTSQNTAASKSMRTLAAKPPHEERPPSAPCSPSGNFQVAEL
eukprot:TRINITY_DN14269_c0_g1_i1.p1 TRINITY_DN14269_c0_g1~~TRINITY_DN14269_c0_g1_i1.p1  ORF type:complete len:977 (+),score=126.51 TRINITY_DN14269_c0_g1_i1:236-3166(+)